MKTKKEKQKLNNKEIFQFLVNVNKKEDSLKRELSEVKGNIAAYEIKIEDYERALKENKDLLPAKEKALKDFDKEKYLEEAILPLEDMQYLNIEESYIKEINRPLPGYWRGKILVFKTGSLTCMYGSDAGKSIGKFLISFVVNNNGTPQIYRVCSLNYDGCPHPVINPGNDSICMGDILPSEVQNLLKVGNIYEALRLILILLETTPDDYSYYRWEHYFLNRTRRLGKYTPPWLEEAEPTITITFGGGL